jgi:ferritin-like metal-binding protein YciE
MPTMSEPRELFLHELGDMLYAEKAIEKTLPKLQKEASDRELAQGFAHHLDETKQQIANLESVFKAMGEPAKAEKCPGIEGIKEEHDQFMESEDPSDEICDLFLTGAAARTEHYEIAAYTGLVEMANALGESECAKLLGENLRQEQDMLQNVESSSKRLMKETLGVGSRT